jgi:hypothetical protein
MYYLWSVVTAAVVQIPASTIPAPVARANTKIEPVPKLRRKQ